MRSCPRTSQRLRATSFEDQKARLGLDRHGAELAPRHRGLLAIFVTEHAIVANEQIDVLEQQHRHGAEAEDEPDQDREPSHQAHEVCDVGRQAADEVRADRRRAGRDQQTCHDEQAFHRARSVDAEEVDTGSCHALATLPPETGGRAAYLIGAGPKLGGGDQLPPTPGV